MSGRLHRLVAVVRADVLIRLRRPSTAVLFVLLSIIPYMWIPKPTSGHALIQVAGRRALYNSAAVGMATAVLGTLFLGLAGFYIVSNALRRDVLSRCGYVIASTTLRGSEYIVGKFAGNVAFLTLFTCGYMVAAMAMVLVRGEAPLEPLVFAKQYLMLMPPAIVFVSAIAIVFESTPLLRTKFGDVAYFFLWMMLMGAAAATLEKHFTARWAASLDVSGLGFVMQQIREFTGQESLAIGMSDFDATKPPIVFNGLQMTREWVLPRVLGTLWPMALLILARPFFHRFDPARVRVAPNEGTRRSWSGRLNMLAKPLARVVVRAGNFVARLPLLPSFVRAAVTDAVATLAAFPLVVVAIIGFAIAALTSDPGALFAGVLPIAYAVCGIAIADVSSRDKRAGTTALTFAVPGLRANNVLWKFASTLLVAIAFLGIPLARAIALRPRSAVALLVGLVFITATATALGIISSNPKTFTVLFLLFCYVTSSDHGATPALDYAGFAGKITPALTLTYAAIAIASLALAQLYHRYDLHRRW